MSFIIFVQSGVPVDFEIVKIVVFTGNIASPFCSPILKSVKQNIVMVLAAEAGLIFKSLVPLIPFKVEHLDVSGIDIENPVNGQVFHFITRVCAPYCSPVVI